MADQPTTSGGEAPVPPVDASPPSSEPGEEPGGGSFAGTGTPATQPFGSPSGNPTRRHAPMWPPSQPGPYAADDGRSAQPGPAWPYAPPDASPHDMHAGTYSPSGQYAHYAQADPYGHHGAYASPGQYGPPGTPGGAPWPYAPPPYYPPSGYPPQPYGWHYGQPLPPSAPRRTPEEARRRRRRAFILAGVMVLALGAGIGIGAWIAPTSPATSARALVSKAVAAGTQAGSFHYVELSTFNHSPDDIVGDATPDGGRQAITERSSSGSNEIYDLRLVDGVVYFRGNETAVVDQLGVPASAAAADAGKWISVKKGEGDYSTFADGITTKSNLSQIQTNFQPSTVEAAGSSTTRIDGSLLVGSPATPVGTAQLLIASTTSLPRSLAGRAVSGADQLIMSWTFSKWHESLTVKAPSNAIPYSSLGATPPKGS